MFAFLSSNIYFLFPLHSLTRYQERKQVQAMGRPYHVLLLLLPTQIAVTYRHNIYRKNENGIQLICVPLLH